MGAFFETTPTVWNAVRWIVGAPRPIQGDEPMRGSNAPRWIAGAAVLSTLLFTLYGPLLVSGLEHVGSPLRVVSLALLTFFLHGSVLHLVGNLAFMDALWDEVENTLGVRRTLTLLGVAHASSCAFELVAYGPDVVAIGASGGLSGLFVAYAVLHPHRELEFPTGFLLLPALRGHLWVVARSPWFLGIWTVLQVAFFALGDQTVSYAGHLGGAAGGLALTLVWRRDL